jgi:hypothetical protein
MRRDTEREGGDSTGEPSLEIGTWETGHLRRTNALHVRCIRLEVVGGPNGGTGRTFSQPVVRIGTHRSCDLVLTDRRVSRFHCEVALDDRGYRVRDLGSTNGTTIDRLRVQDGYLRRGSRIRIGESDLYLVPLAESVVIELSEADRLGGLVGDSVAMRRLYATIQQIAPSIATALITGETGTGKELVAEAIHDSSPRHTGPLVVVDCGAAPANLLEDELFGHGPGAATAGAFERAHGGTLFLDDIGELPLELQPKLLRALESRPVRRIGGSQDIPCDVRLVAATNRDLVVEVNRRSFHADLYYRLAVALIQVPPLRDRRDDIPRLVEHFLYLLPDSAQRTLPALVLERFLRHPWPGNVRELRNAVERAVGLSRPGA